MVDGTGRERSRAGVDEEGARLLTAGIRRLWDPSLFTLTVQIAQTTTEVRPSDSVFPALTRKTAGVTKIGDCHGRRRKVPASNSKPCP
jgi:hypothetical protein